MKDSNIVKNICTLTVLVREKKPLIHHLTNYVTVNDCANIVLASGASPIMADDLAEVEEMVTMASALVLNIGTLNQRTVESMMAAGKKANELGIPVVLDPVGAGATVLRTSTCRLLLENIKLAVMRGNVSEIKAVGGFEATTKGVDVSQQDLLNSKDLDYGRKIVQTLSKKFGCIVAMTGEVDLISDGTKTYSIYNGHPMLSSITGTGCMCSSLIGAYCGITSDYLLAALSGVMVMGLAGEKAYQQTWEANGGNGTFRIKLIDAVSLLTGEDIKERGRIGAE